MNAATIAAIYSFTGGEIVENLSVPGTGLEQSLSKAVIAKDEVAHGRKMPKRKGGMFSKSVEFVVLVGERLNKLLFKAGHPHQKAIRNRMFFRAPNLQGLQFV